jgi:hypothetical protein
MHIDVWGYDGDVPLSAEIVTAGGLVTLIPNEDDGELDTRINARFSRGVRKIGSGAAGLAAFPAASA